jgi:hypothetical protein
MKIIVASVGLVALGTSGLQADTGSSLISESTKPWSVSATLRGFYDDNINSAPDSSTLVAANGERYHRGTLGFEVSPAISVTWPWEQTTLSLGYIYSFKDYQFKPVGNTDTVDMTHSFNAALDHSFNELYRASIHDSFVIGQEPDFLRAGNTYSTFQRLSGSNIRNYGTATLDGEITPVLGFEVGYANAYYNYAADQTLPASSPTGFQPSEGGLLNRIEQSVHLDSRWQIAPQTVAIVGYQFADIDYTEGQMLIGPTYPSSVSNTRNNRGQYGYAGFDETFRPDLTASVRVGARYTDYYNDPSVSAKVTPFAQVSMRWSYGVESYVEAGFTHDREATDLVGNGGANGTSLTMDSETSALYATVNHRLFPNIYGSLTGQFQDSEYSGGQYNSETDRFYTMGANLEYRVSNYLSTQLGYNYDRLESDIRDRSFDRNRVYLGFTASY